VDLRIARKNQLKTYMTFEVMATAFFFSIEINAHQFVELSWIQVYSKTQWKEDELTIIFR